MIPTYAAGSLSGMAIDPDFSTGFSVTFDIREPAPERPAARGRIPLDLALFGIDVIEPGIVAAAIELPSRTLPRIAISATVSISSMLSTMARYRAIRREEAAALLAHWEVIRAVALADAESRLPPAETARIRAAFDRAGALSGARAFDLVPAPDRFRHTALISL